MLIWFMLQTLILYLQMMSLYGVLEQSFGNTFRCVIQQNKIARGSDSLMADEKDIILKVGETLEARNSVLV